MHQYGRWKSTKTSGVYFFYKSLSFHSRTSVRTHNISSNTSSGYIAEYQEERLFLTRQHSCFGVTHCENSKVQIAVFSK